MADEDQDKTEQATPFKLKEAKRRGEVAKSLEFNSFIIILGMLGVLVVWSKQMITGLLNTNRAIFSHSHKVDFTANSVVIYFADILGSAFTIMGPFFVGMMILAVLMNILQTGPTFSMFPITPDFKRLNPATGFKRVFSKKMIFEAIKSVIKLAIFGSIIYVIISSLIPAISTLLNTNPDTYAKHLINLSIKLVFALLLAVFVVAMIDLVYTRIAFGKKMMMSRREMKDEVKRREGDPQIKQKMKEVQREAANRTQSIKRVPDADVIITNPTHLAVAVKYDKTKSASPYVLAKGAGSLAEKIKLLARKHNVPIIENKPLAREIFYSTDINQNISASLFSEIARVLVWAYSRKSKNKLQLNGEH